MGLDVQVNSASEPVGTLDVALGHAARLLEKDPRLAIEQADEILKAVPGHPFARLILGTAYRHAGQTGAALLVLEPLAREQPSSPPVHIELAVALGEAGRATEAISTLRHILQLKPDSADGWRLLAGQLDAIGDADGADRARAAHIKAATKDPRLLEAAAALVENDLPVAEARLRTHLKSYPTDVSALRMLAEVAVRLKRHPEAQALLERCLELAPSFEAARHNYAVVLNREGKAAQALPQVERLLAGAPREPAYRNLKAAILANAGDFADSIKVYEELVKEVEHPKIWMSYGHSLKTQRRLPESIAAYRHAIELDPTLGEVYWSLANLKTFRFDSTDVAAMRAALGTAGLSDEDRLHFEFALGKALEDQGDYEASFGHYERGNAIRKKQHPYNPEDNAKFVKRSKAVFTREFFAARKEWGAEAPDPIFIVGLPRAGSTLIEQILSSHPSVEGTMELPDIPRIAAEIFRREAPTGTRGFAHAVAAFTAEELRALGERYLAETRSQRKTDKPFFIDKMPNNYLYVPLIHLMLPNAKIIDARRHPMGCCFSGFKQHFARGQSFTYSLDDVGKYYRHYVELMAHVDSVLPGLVHRVFHENMIEETELQVRDLLAHCGLPFDERCLRFYENERAVRTASSEQVRQPIFRDGMDQWKHYEPWLGPLRQALGSVLEAYPTAPEFPSSLDLQIL
jgi:predicted Zn-dependent protease